MMEVCESCDIIHNKTRCPLCEANEKIEYIDNKYGDAEAAAKAYYKLERQFRITESLPCPLWDALDPIIKELRIKIMEEFLS